MIEVPLITQEHNKKSYGLTAGGFRRGMNTDPYTGAGFQVSQGMKRNNGRMVKLFGDSLRYNFGSGVSVVKIESYEKSNGTFQELYFINDGSTVKLRAIEEDGTVVTPTGGAGDVDFESNIIRYAQISLTGYISSFTKSSIYLWDGSSLTTISGATGYTSLSKEGIRLVYTGNGVAGFSGADNPLTGLASGIGSEAYGNYTPNTSGTPVAAYASSVGTLLAFTSGFELHTIVQLDSGDGLKDDTRILDFQYKGEGIRNANQFCFGSYYGYAVNKSGIIRIDPRFGRSVNLLEEEEKTKSYRIKEYFDSFDQTNAVIAYAPKQQMICVALNTNNTGQNDIVLLYHEPTGDFHVVKGNYDTFGVVNEELYAGSSVDGRVFKLFDRNTYSDGYGNTRKVRLISEWDTIGDHNRQKIPLDFFSFFNAHSESTVTINLYINGDIDAPVATFTHTPDDQVDTSDMVSTLGEYILGMGRGDDASASDYSGKNLFNEPFYSYCWEIIEESIYDFVVNDVTLEFIAGVELPQSNSLANKPFNL